MATPGTLGRGTCCKVSQTIGVLHLNVPGGIGSGKVSVGVCLKSIPQVTPLNVGELKV